MRAKVPRKHNELCSSWQLPREERHLFNTNPRLADAGLGGDVRHAVHRDVDANSARCFRVDGRERVSEFEQGVEWELALRRWMLSRVSLETG